MPRLAYLTRGNQNPQDKPKIYFSAHPDDYEKYLRKISDEILEVIDCAVWYDEEPQPCEQSEYAADEKVTWFEELEHMSLFVIPVTNKFLFSLNRAVDEEFRYALEKNIPVLPLIMEPNLIEVFNQKCGKLHTLDATGGEDVTAIPYKEKLAAFLKHVLVGDETLARIRQESDGHMFLSYRKKDRKYAKDLMRRIHESDGCRDIAIWYDEFLVFGESFDALIEEKLKESKLFTLVVTPNLVNEENYVMRIEYPKAREEKKKILPVEMVETDQDILKERYEGITGCVDKDDAPALQKALQEVFTQKEETAEHDFLIGLAYLNGIEREVNRETAVKLITNSADKNREEAVRKLIQMYRYGQGTKRNLLLAIRWQEKLVDVLEKGYRKDKQIGMMEDLIWESMTLGGLYEEQKQIADARLMYEKAKRLGEEVLKKPTQGILHYYIMAAMKLTDMQNAGGRNPILKKRLEMEYSKLLKMCLTMWKRAQSVETLHDMFCIQVSRAQLYYELGNFGSAKADFEEAYKHLAGLKEYIGNETYYQNMVALLQRRGDFGKVNGRMEDAKADFEKAIALNRQWQEESKSDESARCLSISYEKMGDFCRDCRMDKDALPEALDWFEKSLAICRELSEKEQQKSILYQLDLAYGCRRVGGIKELQKCTEEAAQYYQEETGILEALLKETDSAELKLHLASAYDDKGDICLEKLDLAVKEKNEKAQLRYAKEAEYFYQNAFSIRNGIYKKEMQTIEVERALQISYDNFGRLALRNADPEQSRADALFHFEKELEICKRLAEAAPENMELQSDLLIAYSRFGTTYANPPEDLEKSKEYFQKALEVAERMGGNIDAKTVKIVENIKDIVQHAQKR